MGTKDVEDVYGDRKLRRRIPDEDPLGFDSVILS